MRLNISKVTWLLACLIVILTECGAAYKILIVTPIGSKSLYELSKSLGFALGDAGHDVFLINSFSNSSGHPKVKDVHTGAKTELVDGINVFNLRSTFAMMAWLKDVILETAPAMWTNPEIISLWQNRHTFDAIIMTAYANEIGTPFLIEYKGSHIGICTPGVEYFIISSYGHWLPLSVVPQITLPFDEYMTFFERAVNPLVQQLCYHIYYYIIYPVCQQVLERFFPKMGPYDKLYMNSSLLLINGHFALDSPIPLLPNQIEIGTINIKEPQPLQKDLLDFIEGSGENGIIYFNLGSIVRSKDMPMQHKKAFLSAFAKMPQRILWKYEENNLELPPNVMTRKWLPQQDILGHPKTRVFISHCGNLGTQEAKYHGVPILAIPVAFDQHRNAARVVRQGFGLQLSWDDLSEEALVETLNSLINDTKYITRLKTVSKILHDQKETPQERAVWWVEYTIRHEGAQHLTYAGKRLHFLQYIMVDVIALWLLVIVTIFYIFYKALSIFWKRCITKKRKLE